MARRYSYVRNTIPRSRAQNSFCWNGPIVETMSGLRWPKKFCFRQRGAWAIRDPALQENDYDDRERLRR